MNLTEQLTDYVNAAFSGLWVLTQEPDEAEGEITQLARSRGWKLAAWDVAGGLRVPSEPGTYRGDAQPGDPLAVLRAVPTLADRDGTALVLLHNFNRFLGNPEVIQTTFAQLIAGKQQRTFLVVLAPVVQIPVELEKLFVVLEHALPDRGQLERIARELTSDQPEDMPRGDDLQRVLDAAAGLTRYEAEGSFALSLTRHNALRPESIWELKAQALKKNNLAECGPAVRPPARGGQSEREWSGTGSSRGNVRSIAPKQVLPGRGDGRQRRTFFFSLQRRCGPGRVGSTRTALLAEPK
jgi:hypothetical protein